MTPAPAGPVPTRREAEAAIARAVMHLEKQHTGRGPADVVTAIVDDLVVVRLKGALTAAEARLAAADDRGPYLVRQARLELTELARPALEAAVTAAAGVGVVSLHTDLCPATGERLIVLTLTARPRLAGD